MAVSPVVSAQYKGRPAAGVLFALWNMNFPEKIKDLI
jgi:hypothetical protein